MDEHIFFAVVFFFYSHECVQGDTNQITYLIENMDKWTKEGEQHIATETLKACFGTLVCGL